MTYKKLLRLAILAWAGASIAARADTDASEKDYFTELPVVLSVSRLAQAQADTPGAVTVIDGDMIRRSGARDLADLLRLVPGFIISHLEGGARPIVAYHADYDAITRHLQVLIDGRSVYSSLLVGSASYGMLGVVLENIERIEVLRGSNSAAYGANAFQGVVNVITRHSADAQGGMVSVSAGEGGVNDGVARIGWSSGKGAFRLTAASRSDDGFAAMFDSSRLEQVHFRGDIQASDQDELTLLMGHSRFLWGVNDTLTTGHNESWQNSYANLHWVRQLNHTDQLKVRATFDDERFSNYFPLLRADGASRRTEIEAQHIFVLNPRWQVVWGGQYRHEQVVSTDLFYTNPAQAFDVWRVFGNMEWRPSEKWVVNLGGLWERHSIVGDNTAPRFMVNYQVLPGHTLRAGATSAYKLPTLFELRSDWRFNGTPIIRASGRAQPERIESTELGYLGEFKSFGLTADVRIFEEKVRDLMRYERPCPGCPNDIVNKDPSTQRGWEGQVRWEPRSGTQLLLNHTELKLFTDVDNSAPQDRYRAPSHISTLAWFQKLPAGWDFTLIHSRMGPMFWIRQSDTVPGFTQTDVRLARRFRLGPTQAEAALTVRAADGGHVDFVERNYPVMELDRRAVATLRLDF